MASEIVNRLRNLNPWGEPGWPQDIKNAADHIEALERKVAELEAEVATYQGLLDAAIDDYNDAIKPKPADKPFVFADPNAQREWERQRKERGQ
jgi:hypothetical protein